VFPEEVERVLESIDGVREAAVVAHANGGERVHAVLVLDPAIEAATVVRQANARLDSHQRIREMSIWPAAALPRTEAMRKLKHEDIRRWVAGEAPVPRGAPALRGVENALAAYAHGSLIGPQTTLDELGLSSLDRVELTLALEAQTGVSLSETAITESRSVADLQHLVDTAAQAPCLDDALRIPGWAAAAPARWVRNASQALWILPMAHVFLRLHVVGREPLEAIDHPVIFAANHQSVLDTPAILLSLPRRWRRRLSVAMAKDLFEAHFDPAHHRWWQRVTIGAAYYLAVLFFNAFPVPRTGPGTLAALRHAGALVSEGFSILIFPEGHRTERGEIQSFQPGVGMMASRLRLPIVPVRLDGLDRVMHRGAWWPRRGDVRVTFGSAIQSGDGDPVALTARVERAVASAGTSAPTPPAHALPWRERAWHRARIRRRRDSSPASPDAPGGRRSA
jgi:long-chain acyl-CoA synthetase